LSCPETWRIINILNPFLKIRFYTSTVVGTLLISCFVSSFGVFVYVYAKQRDEQQCESQSSSIGSDETTNTQTVPQEEKPEEIIEWSRSRDLFQSTESTDDISNIVPENDTEAENGFQEDNEVEEIQSLGTGIRRRKGKVASPFIEPVGSSDEDAAKITAAAMESHSSESDLKDAQEKREPTLRARRGTDNKLLAPGGRYSLGSGD
jgi:hypothetical protein